MATKLEAEIDAVVGSRPPTSDDVGHLRYTGMVVAEAMRLYPPSWRLVRRAIKDFDVGGYVVPAQSQVVMSQYVMHRDKRYFPDPSRFDPQRWTPEARAARPQYSYFPFGGGTRRCIGEGFALMEAVLVIATLAQSWRLRLSPGHRVQTHPTHILRPRYGMQMILEERRESQAAQSAGRPATLHAIV
jgi:cytochrome P450